MRFFAKIRNGSSIERLWREHKRLSGTVDGIKFRLAGYNGIYVSDEIDVEQIEKIKARQDQAIIVEMMSKAPEFESVPIPVEKDRPRLRSQRRSG